MIGGAGGLRAWSFAELAWRGSEQDELVRHVFSLSDAGHGYGGEPQYALLPTSGVAPNGKTILSWDQAAAQLTRESNGWGLVLGLGATVTYAYRSTAPFVMPSDTSGFSQFSAAQIAATETALALWADAANITFVRANASGYSNSATILFGNYSAGQAGASAFAFFPGSTLAGASAGDIWINNTLPDNQNFTLGGFGLQVLAHEIGHAIGLSHPGDYNGGAPTYDLDAGYWQDSRAFSIMSYFGSPNVGGNLPAFSDGPQLHDIAGAQLLYGANLATRTGDTVYGFNSNTGLAHYTITSAAQGAVFAIWDGGGVDTLDLSGYSQNADIDLREESHSSAGPTDTMGPAVFNFSIARGVVIENAIGGAGNDTLTGNSAANRLDGGLGADVMEGGSGDDTYIVDNAGDVTFEASAANGIDTVRASVTRGLGNHLEHLVLTGSAAIFGVGNTLNNTIIGNDAFNRLFGMDGNDTLDGGLGADVMEGGTGDDTYIVDNAGDVTFEASAANGTDTVRAAVTRGLGNHLEHLVLTGSAAIFGVGNTLNNAITGNDAFNRLFGMDGNDTLDGGLGADVMEGGTGDDTYIVDNVGDVTYEASAANGIDTVRASVTRGLGNHLEHLVLTGRAAISGVGNTLNNSLTGNDAANGLFGLGGDDTLDGGLGADAMEGGTGDDTYIVDNSGDVTFEASAANGIDTVRTSVTRGLGNHLEHLVLTGTGAINGVGNALNNSLTGNDAVNRLFGMDGDDTLDGGLGGDVLEGGTGDDILAGGFGDDVLFGGAGDDSFVFAPGSGLDRVLGFLAGGVEDTIDLSAYDGSGITWTIAQSGANTVFAFSNGDQITLVNVNVNDLVQIDPFGWG